MLQLRLLFGTILFFMLTACFASKPTIEVACYPTISVADGRSTITVTATVRDSSGNPVPDGTRVVFTSELGTFKEPLVQTQNGIARAVLLAGLIPGLDNITVTAMAYQATNTFEFEFVSDRSQLSGAKDFIELSSSGSLVYSVERRTVGGLASNRGVKLTFRDIEIEADELQLHVPSYEVRASRALLKFGGREIEFGDLYFRLNGRRGFGTTRFREKQKTIVPNGNSFAMVEGEEREVFGICEVTPSDLKRPTESVPDNLFNFIDTSSSQSTISAKKIVAYPRKEVQFQQAEIFVSGARVMKVPLYQVSVWGQSKLITDQMVNVQDNQLAINYPHYLSLKPGHSTLLRFSMGRSGGRSLGVDRGANLSFETNWSSGDRYEGDFILGNIGRKDWGASVRHFMKFDSTSELNAQLDFPSHSAIFGNVNFNKHFPAYSLSLTATDNRSFTDTTNESQRYSMSFDRDPIKVGKMPLRFTYGVNASHQTSKFLDSNLTQSAVGLRASLQMLPIQLDRKTNISGSFTASKLQGHNTNTGLTLVGSALMTHNLSSNASVLLGYDFYDDGFNSEFIGHHQLSGRFFYSKGAAQLSIAAAKGLDLDSSNYQVDASYRLNNDWRLSYSYTFARYFGESFMDYNVILGYRLGIREVGLTWSHRTKRFGIQILGTTIY